MWNNMTFELIGASIIISHPDGEMRLKFSSPERAMEAYGNKVIDLISHLQDCAGFVEEVSL
jgi:hypothetical protein